jgi:pyridoxamine 5'-phosphate oxidase family protein
MASLHRAGPVFTDAELAYLRDVHPIGRLATVGRDGMPHVMPLGMYRVDAASGTVDTLGRDLQTTKKWRDVRFAPRAAIVFDDVAPPFRPRGLEIRGRAEVIDGPEPAIRIHPQRVVAWGLDETGTMRNARGVVPRDQGAGVRRPRPVL